MVELAMKRVDKLEDKLDSANKRTVVVGTVLTAASILARVLGH
jgi:hypothetical protein